MNAFSFTLKFRDILHLPLMHSKKDGLQHCWIVGLCQVLCKTGCSIKSQILQQLYYLKILEHCRRISHENLLLNNIELRFKLFSSRSVVNTSGWWSNISIIEWIENNLINKHFCHGMWSGRLLENC